MYNPLFIPKKKENEPQPLYIELYPPPQEEPQKPKEEPNIIIIELF